MDNLQPALNGDNNENCEVKKLNLFQKIIGVVISPAETMRSIAEKPRILVPILIMALVPLLVNIIRLPLYKDMQRDITLKTTEMMASKFNTPVMSAADIEKAVSAKLIYSLAGIPFAVIVAWLISTVILFALLKIFGGQGKLKQCLAITGYANVIMVLSQILTFLVSFKTQSLKLDLSLGIFAGQLLSGSEGSFMFGFLYTVLAGIGVFTIWYYIVTAIGLAQASKISNVKVYTAVIIFFILSTLFTGAISGVSEAFTSAISSTI